MQILWDTGSVDNFVSRIRSIVPTIAGSPHKRQFLSFGFDFSLSTGLLAIISVFPYRGRIIRRVEFISILLSASHWLERLINIHETTRQILLFDVRGREVASTLRIFASCPIFFSLMAETSKEVIRNRKGSQIIKGKH